jgi:hypothetical protein
MSQCGGARQGHPLHAALLELCFYLPPLALWTWLPWVSACPSPPCRHEPIPWGHRDHVLLVPAAQFLPTSGGSSFPGHMLEKARQLRSLSLVEASPQAVI